MGIISRTAFAAIIVTVFAGSAHSDSFSFTGNFINDNDVQLFTFSLALDATVTVQTLGYGGGINAAGMALSPGGFESVLQIYNAPSGIAVGGPIQPGPDPGCGPRNPDPGRLNFCQDAFQQISLTAGSYFLALTQSANDPLGNLSDGFFFVDAVPDPNFNHGFVGTLDMPGASAWAVDILNVDAAAPVSAVPEPATVLLLAAGLILTGITVRRKSC